MKERDVLYVRVPPELLKKLKKEAEKVGVPLNAYVTMILQELMENG